MLLLLPCADSDVSNSPSESSDDEIEEEKRSKKRKASDVEELDSSSKQAKTGDTELTREEEEKRQQEMWQRLNSADGKSADSCNVNETTKDTKKADQETKKTISPSIPSRANLPVVRKATGVSNLLAKLGKKKESTLARTKSDWDQFKKQEGIEEELTEHTRSKGSYVDKQEFLQRTDLRQFEQEKSVRDKVRSRMLP